MQGDACKIIEHVIGDAVCLYALDRFSDERGVLFPVEFAALPFRPERAFVIKDVPRGTVRGEHAHKTTRQFLVRLSGKIEVEVRYRGVKANVILRASDVGLFLTEEVWASQTFVSENSELMVFASEPYDPSGYIADGAAG